MLNDGITVTPEFLGKEIKVLLVLNVNETYCHTVKTWCEKRLELSCFFVLFMSSENEHDASTSASTRKGKFLILVLVLMLGSRKFSRGDKHSYACTCVCD